MSTANGQLGFSREKLKLLSSIWDAGSGCSPKLLSQVLEKVLRQISADWMHPSLGRLAVEFKSN